MLGIVMYSVTRIQYDGSCFAHNYLSLLFCLKFFSLRKEIEVQSILTTRPIIAIERGGRTGDLVKYKTMYSNTRQFIGKLVLKDLFNCLILLYWRNFIGTVTD